MKCTGLPGAVPRTYAPMQSAVTCSKIRCAISGVALTKKVSESSGSVLKLTPGAAFSRSRIAVRARPSVAMP